MTFRRQCNALVLQSRREKDCSASSLACAIGRVAGDDSRRSHRCSDGAEGEARCRIASDDDRGTASLADAIADWTSESVRCTEDDACGEPLAKLHCELVVVSVDEAWKVVSDMLA